MNLVSWAQNNIGLAILFCVLGFLFLVLIRDILQKKHTIQHNFPLVGHIRYFLEKVGPELRQYIVTNDKEERPFNRDERRWVYASAKKQNNYFGFGTTELLYEPGYPTIKHSAFPVIEDEALFRLDNEAYLPCAKVMGESHKRKRPYHPQSIINISAMSYGSLGKRAISALNQGAKIANCYHNTGEGSISPYHLFGADLVVQIGTGYFGCRDDDGNFVLEKLVNQVKEHSQIRAIELKLSQGAKPGKGGVLPAAKISHEIAKIRHIPFGKDCLSPSSHREFKSVKEMIAFIETMARATGLPVGIKSAVGQIDFWQELAREMKKQKAGPDFIAIDGAEGGTGAAPLTYTDHVALPFKVGFKRIYREFQKVGITDDILFIGASKLGFPDRSIVALAMGCDLVNVAREAMLAIGCIQAQRCHSGHCPAGVATQNRWLEAGLNVEDKAIRCANYIKTFRKELLALSHTAGYEHPAQFTLDDIEISQGMNEYIPYSQNLGYTKKKVSLKQIKKIAKLTPAKTVV